MAARHLYFLLFICVVWGFTFVAGKAGLEELPPILFTCLRYGLLTLVLLPFLKWHAGQMRRIMAVALTMGGLHFSVFYTGLSLSDNVSIVAIVVQMSMPFATILSYFFLGEKIGLWRLTGLLLAMGGVFVIGFDPALFDDLDAVAFILLAAFMGAVGTVLMRPMKKIHTFQLQAWIALISLPILVAWSGLAETGQIEAIREASWHGWGGVFYTALGASLIGHAGMFYLLQRYEVATIGPVTLLAPIFGALFGVLIWGDVLTLRIMLGGAIVLSGVLVIALREGQPTPPMIRPVA